MKRKWLGWCSRWVAIVVLAVTPQVALAQRDQQEIEIVDARLEGYAQNVTLPPTGVGLTWLLFVVLMVITCAGLFKDARRTHLD